MELELIPDNNFKLGFCVQAASGAYAPETHWPTDVDLTYGENEGGPTGWVVEQHGCNHGLGDVYNHSTGNKPDYNKETGYYIFEDPSKILAANPTKGGVYLMMDASKEYTHARKNFEYWPHLILLNGFTRNEIKLSEFKSLDLNMDLTLKCIENFMSEEEYNPGMHTAQFVMNFLINTDAPLDAGKYFWFSINLYDYRFPHSSGEFGAVDSGKGDATGMYIYGMDMRNVLSNSLSLDITEKVNIDLYSRIKDGIIYTVSHGFLTNTTFDNLYISSFNIGWEVPGTFKAGIEMTNLSLKGVLK